MNRLRLAIIGARGFGKYGGFETFVGELVPRLVGRGYDIYCSHERHENGENPSKILGSMAVYFPLRFPHNYTLRKIFENLYDGYFVFKCSLSPRCNLIYCLGTLSGPFLIVPKILGIPTMVNVDGLEWRRAKLSYLERILLKFYFTISCGLSNRIVIDNGQLLQYIPGRFRKKAIFLPYGVSNTLPMKWEPDSIAEHVRIANLHVNQNNYWLIVARLEPENNIHVIVEGYLRSRSTKPLVIVGDFTSSKYKTALDNLLTQAPKDKTVLMTGSIYERRVLEMLRYYCLAYLHGHSVGGTNPSLLEAMSAGNLVVAHDNPFNREVGGEAARYFRCQDDLAMNLNEIESNAWNSSKLKTIAQKRVSENYDWVKVANSYNDTFMETISK